MTRKAETRARAGTARAATEAIQKAAAGWPSPPVRLSAKEQRFWDSVMVARLPQQWAQVDLHVAAELARALCDINEHRIALKKEGSLIDGKANARHALIETLNRRVLAQMRLLQIHAVATVGPKREQGGTKAEAEAAAAALRKPKNAAQDIDSLLAQPRRFQ